MTITTRNSSDAHRAHNIRDPRCVAREPHIDPNGIHETWGDIDPREAYARIFGSAVAEYNKQQERSDRRIDDYYRHICRDKQKHPVYEMLIGVYPAEDEHLSIEEQRDILLQFCRGWKENNPNLRMVGCYYHADEEGQPHVHIDYVPVAQYDRGMKVRNGLNRALEQQGFRSVSKKETAQILWERSENQRLEEICKEHGFIVEHPMRGKGVEHLNTLTFKAAKELERVSNQLERAQSLLVDVAQEAVELGVPHLERAGKALDLAERIERERER